MSKTAQKTEDKVRGKKLRHVVTVDFVVKPEFLSEFMNCCRENAKASVAVEEECFRFDVLTPISKNTNKVFLYEIYASQKAFDDHLNTQHYKDFNQATAHMVISKSPMAFVLDEYIKVD